MSFLRNRCRRRCGPDGAHSRDRRDESEPCRPPGRRRNSHTTPRRAAVAVAAVGRGRVRGPTGGGAPALQGVPRSARRCSSSCSDASSLSLLQPPIAAAMMSSTTTGATILYAARFEYRYAWRPAGSRCHRAGFSPRPLTRTSPERVVRVRPRHRHLTICRRTVGCVARSPPSACSPRCRNVGSGCLAQPHSH